MASPSVVVRNLDRTFQVHRRAPGLLASIRSLVRREYETVRAVADLSFTIRAGERVGFLGENGAGKTTTLKILAGLLHPSSGEARVSGFVPAERAPAFLKSITLLMGNKEQLHWDLPPSDTFALLKAIYGVPDRQFEATLAELGDLFGLEGVVAKPTRQLSLGERMKCEIAASLLHRPAVLFFDEPTIGLDVSMQFAVRNFIRRYVDRSGATLLLTSHDMSDVAALCERVIVIRRGALLYDGSLSELVRSLRPDKRVTLHYRAAPDLDVLERVGSVAEHDEHRAVLRVAPANLGEAIAYLTKSLDVHDIGIDESPLDEVMRDLFASASSDAPSGAAP